MCFTGFPCLQLLLLIKNICASTRNFPLCIPISLLSHLCSEVKITSIISTVTNSYDKEQNYGFPAAASKWRSWAEREKVFSEINVIKRSSEETKFLASGNDICIKVFFFQICCSVTDPASQQIFWKGNSEYKTPNLTGNIMAHYPPWKTSCSCCVRAVGCPIPSISKQWVSTNGSLFLKVAQSLVWTLIPT